MNTKWIDDSRTADICARHEAFWRNELAAGPLLWITVPRAVEGTPPVEPDQDELLWTDVDYVIRKAEYELAHTCCAGDALPVFNPWLGPDQFAAWLGADLLLKPREFTSWARPFADDWTKHLPLQIAADNRWWTLYLQIVQASVDAGHGRWITAYPDLHTGVDALSAICGPERLMFDMLEKPDVVYRAMEQLTQLWKQVVDTVSSVVLPAGQGTSNWTMGWSRDRFVCIGQNDFSCLISPTMFETFCLRDTVECAEHVDHTIYHLDGPGALQHLPRLLQIDRLDCIQWIQGAGQALPSQWIELLRQIQQAGKSVQLYYGGSHGGHADFHYELEVLCRELDVNRLFVVIEARTVEEADLLCRDFQFGASRV